LELLLAPLARTAQHRDEGALEFARLLGDAELARRDEPAVDEAVALRILRLPAAARDHPVDRRLQRALLRERAGEQILGDGALAGAVGEHRGADPDARL